jgi:hypothetical protein
MTLVKLPKGIKVYVGGKCWSGQIPHDICPDKYLPAKAKPASKKAD